MQKQTNLSLLLFLVVIFLIGCNKKDNPDNPSNQPTLLECNHFTNESALMNNPNKPVDYIVDCIMSIGRDVVIEAGTVIHFKSGGGLRINENGSLRAIGNPSNPIIFTSDLQERGAWNGLIFFSNNINNILEHCIIEYAGGAAFNSNNDRGGVIIWADSRVRISNSTIRSSDAYGLNLNYQNIEVTLENNTYTQNRLAPLRIIPNYMSRMDSGSAHIGNDEPFIFVNNHTSTIHQDGTIKKLDVPYRIINQALFTNLTINSNVQIEAGAALEFRGGTGMRVNEQASFNAVGTATDPIVFTGVDKQPGSWAGISFMGTKSNLNRIEHAIIEYSGTPQERGAITMSSSPTLTVRNTLFQALQSCAFYSPNTNPGLTQADNVFTNVGGEVCTN